MEHHFPFFKKGYVWGKDILKICLFSSSIGGKIKTICNIKGGGPLLPISKCLFWPKHPSTTMDVSHGGVFKEMEIKGSNGIHILGRYSSPQFNKERSGKGFKNNPGGSLIKWHVDKREKCGLEPSQIIPHLGFTQNLGGATGGTPGKNENNEKRIRKTVGEENINLSKDGLHFRVPEKFF